MPESIRARPVLPATARHALLVGIVLACVAAAGGIVAAIAGVLAQPAFALAVRGWRSGAPAGRRALHTDAVSLLVAWGGAVGVAALLVVWPLSALRQGGELGAALALSVVVGVGVIGFWRTWPLWHALECDGGDLRQHWRALADRDTGSWHGVAAALCVTLVVATVLALAWMPAAGTGVRIGAAAAAAFAWPLLHLLLQRLAAPAALPLQVVEMTADPAAALFDDADAAEPEIALYAAARSGRVDRALALVAGGADLGALPPEGDRDQRSLAVLAAVLPDLRLLRELIARGVDVNAAHAGMTPLLAATRDSWHGRPDAVMTLLANGADARVTDHEGNTPLHLAARSSDPGVAALLRDAAAELDARNHDGLTPLGVACAAGNWRLAKFLLERGAKPEVDGGTPALLAAAGGDEDDPAGVQLLIRHKARVDARDGLRRSALHAAASSGHTDVLAALLAAGADVRARDNDGRTPLLDAARGGSLAALEALVAAGADVAAVDIAGRNALELACDAETPSVPLVHRLLALGVPADVVGADGRRPADRAAACGRWALVRLLDPEYPLPGNVLADDDADAPAERTPLLLLRASLREGRYDDLETLLRLLGPAELGSLLLDPEAPHALERVEWLLARGADVEARDEDGQTALSVLLGVGPSVLPIVQALLRHGASPAGAGGLARFLAACARDDQATRALEACALELLARGADPFAASPDGDPPLSLAVRLGWPRLLEGLIGHGVDLDARDARGMAALHLAAALGRDEALKLLVRHGASPDACAADGQTPLGVALSGGRRDLADWLDWRGWTLPKRPLAADDLPAAAIVGDAGAVRRLLDLGFDVDTADVQGCTALLRAAGGGHRDVVDVLLARGADPARAAQSGATPLSAAVSMRQGEIVDRLLAAGGSLEQRLPGDVTVLMLAAALGLPDVCARLLTAGADIHAGDAQGLTPLHCAAMYGFTSRDRPRLLALFDTLLLAGAEVDAAAAGGVTPLLLLLGARAEPGTACDEEVVLAAMEHLLDEGVSLDAQDPRGFGPLHLSALHGQLRLARRLLRAGADPDLRDTINRTPREIAVMRGFIDVAAELAPVPSQDSVSMARFLREHR
ncbi:ankyrin repeat domain-containing protein [Luteimonas sp. BDR2-5]|uniref:ankyrin repeat domain-containing protein n=1 Tax=Proluteimonas luteida TaxID=2878685 RepID=UPI001E451604|nr:ankyrin repeat domain-containing protein [Luteimonas sp. BDR2-5]MCD9027243.1 ankyrin repeat domain-containing protein [Luteimonas sp. BDR2-5]